MMPRLHLSDSGKLVRLPSTYFSDICFNVSALWSLGVAFLFILAAIFASWFVPGRRLSLIAHRYFDWVTIHQLF